MKVEIFCLFIILIICTTFDFIIPAAGAKTVNLQMKCQKVENDEFVYLERCENDEVICYRSHNQHYIHTISCFKK